MLEFGADRGTLLIGAIALLALERGAELIVSHRNLARLKANGTPCMASSSAAEYSAMVVVHVLFLAAPWIEFSLRGERPIPWYAYAAIAALLAAQGLRWWTIWTLGPRWNAPAVVAPSLGAVHGGPYRFLRHPNYLAVALEFAALPWVGGTWYSGAVLFAANALLLARRKRQEEGLLAQVPGWSAGFER